MKAAIIISALMVVVSYYVRNNEKIEEYNSCREINIEDNIALYSLYKKSLYTVQEVAVVENTDIKDEKNSSDIVYLVAFIVGLLALSVTFSALYLREKLKAKEDIKIAEKLFNIIERSKYSECLLLKEIMQLIEAIKNESYVYIIAKKMSKVEEVINEILKSQRTLYDNIAKMYYYREKKKDASESVKYFLNVYDNFHMKFLFLTELGLKAKLEIILSCMESVDNLKMKVLERFGDTELYGKYIDELTDKNNSENKFDSEKEQRIDKESCELADLLLNCSIINNMPKSLFFCEDKEQEKSNKRILLWYLCSGKSEQEIIDAISYSGYYKRRSLIGVPYTERESIQRENATKRSAVQAMFRLNHSSSIHKMMVLNMTKGFWKKDNSGYMPETPYDVIWLALDDKVKDARRSDMEEAYKNFGSK